MKRALFLTFILWCAACAKNASSSGEGTMSVNLETDIALSDRTKSDVSQYAAVPTASDFTLTVTNYASEVAWTGKFTDFDPAVKFAAGSYTASVSCGNPEEEGKGKACFGDVQQFEIINLENTPVTLRPALSNCVVKVAAGKYVKNYFNSWEFTLETAAGAVFEPQEGDAFFIDAYKFDLKGVFSTAAKDTVKISKTFKDLQAATLYTVTVDLDNVAANTFTITFNDQVETVSIEEDLN